MKFILKTIVIVTWLVIGYGLLNYHHTIVAQTMLVTGGGLSKTMKSYTNDQYKFAISYPNTWDKIEFTQGITESGRQILVTFLSPLENPSDSFRDYLTIEVANFSPGTALDKSKLIQYGENQANGYRKSLQGFHILARSDRFNNSELNIANPACYKVLYNYIDATAGKINVLDIYCAKDSKIYFLSFQSDLNKYSLYLPLVKLMVNSLKLS
jgi:hypothetical protein